MKSQSNTIPSLYAAPLQGFSFLLELFEAMPIVIFMRALQSSAKSTSGAVAKAR